MRGEFARGLEVGAGIPSGCPILPDSENDPHNESNGDDGDNHLREDTHVPLYHVPVRAERVARVDKNCVPDEGAHGGEQGELHKVHPRDTRG